MIESQLNLLNHIYSLTKEKPEYDILPHNEENHSLIQEADKAFALCQCLGKSLWRPVYREALNKHNPKIEMLTLILLFVPTCMTIWHRRKSFVLNGHLTLNDELVFTKLVLKRFPRATEPLQHRHWILERMESPLFGEIQEDEIALCELLCDKHRCNYMVWQYRRWLFEHFKSNIKTELEKMDIWVRGHPIDVSGWSYREFLLESWLKYEHLDNFLPLLRDELKKVSEILSKLPENEAVWCYRRQLVEFYTQASKMRGDSNVDPKSYDSIISTDQMAIAFPDSDATLHSVNIQVPQEYCQPWSSLLYKRYQRWIKRA